jgi:hypothetical protein
MVSKVGQQKDHEVLVSTDVKKLFHALDIYGSDTISSQFFLQYLKKAGLQRDDVRLEGMHNYLK